MRLLLACVIMLSMVSCVTQRVRNNTLLPAIQQAWPGVRADVVYADSMTEAELAAWDEGVASGDFLTLDVQDLVMQAEAGIQMQLSDGELGPQGASVLVDRARAFGRAVEEYMRVVSLVDYRPQSQRRVAETPLVISRSSWATHPPAALAGEVYR